MIQIYLLSIVFNVFVGCYFIFTTKSSNEITTPAYFSFLSKKNLKLIIGILTFLTGVLKILSSSDVLIVGDLLPAIAGILGGIVFLYEYYINDSDDESKKINFLEKFETNNRKYLGYFCLVVAIIHFFIPTILFL